MRLDDMYEYVKNYFQKNFPESYIMMKKFDLQNFSNEYTKIQNSFKGVDLSTVPQEKIDKEIHKKLDNYVKEYFTELEMIDCSTLYGYVQKILKNRKLDKELSSDNFDHIVKLVMSEVWPLYDSSKLYTTELDNEINSKCDKVCYEILMKISAKIDQLLDLDIFKLRNIDKDSLKRVVIDSILVNEDRKFLERVTSLSVAPEGELSQTAERLQKYIDLYISKYDDTNSVKEVDNTNKSSSINTGNNRSDNDEKANYNRNKMKNGSVKGADVPKEIPYKNGIKQNVIKTVSALLVIATLGGVGAFGIKNHNKKVNDSDANARVEALYGFVDNDRMYHVGDGANRIINFWDNLIQNEIDDNNYRTLGFFEEYQNLYYDVSSNKNDIFLALEDMQKVFKQVQDFVSEGNDNEFGSVIGVDQNRYFFIDFVYDSLVNMGCEEIKDKKYQDAVNAYKFYYFDKQYGVAVGNLSQDVITIIEDMMKMYEEYSEQQKLDLGYLLRSGRSIG